MATGRLPGVLVGLIAAAASVAAVACGVGATPGTSPVTEQSPVVELRTSVSTSYYDTEGASASEILASAKRNGPVDGDGARAVGLATQHASLQTKTVTDGDLCWLSEATVTVDFLMTLPRHVDAASLAPEVRAGFDRWSAAIATHEQRHVDIYLAGAERARTALVETPPQPACDSLKRAVDETWESAMEQTEAEQEAFHVEDRAREAEARAPLAARVEANRARLDELEEEINALDARLDDLRQELDRTSSPSRYNELVDEHNGIVAQRNEVAGELNALVASTNALVDELNWTT